MLQYLYHELCVKEFTSEAIESAIRTKNVEMVKFVFQSDVIKAYRSTHAETENFVRIAAGSQNLEIYKIVLNTFQLDSGLGFEPSFTCFEIFKYILDTCDVEPLLASINYINMTRMTRMIIALTTNGFVDCLQELFSRNLVPHSMYTEIAHLALSSSCFGIFDLVNDKEPINYQFISLSNIPDALTNLEHAQLYFGRGATLKKACLLAACRNSTPFEVFQFIWSNLRITINSQKGITIDYSPQLVNASLVNECVKYANSRVLEFLHSSGFVQPSMIEAATWKNCRVSSDADTQFFKLLFEIKPPVSSEASCLTNVLNNCVVSGNLDLYKFIYFKYKEVASSPWTTNPNYATAALRNEFEIIKFLQSQGDHSDHFAVDNVSYGNRLDILKFFIENGHTGVAAISNSAYEGRLEMLSYLLTLDFPHTHVASGLVRGVMSDRITSIQLILSCKKFPDPSFLVQSLVSQNNIVIVKYIFNKQHKGFQEITQESKDSLLELALVNGYLDIIKFCLEDLNCSLTKENIVPVFEKKYFHVLEYLKSSLILSKKTKSLLSKSTEVFIKSGKIQYQEYMDYLELVCKKEKQSFFKFIFKK
ncbi:hypothetical protein CYY_003392 [Polysphondylium violaceum]|uniref:Ankyrin repeat-containing protein n=1 Tax=Polysphondylium violaceum TaxID=133409 RepID=A0A8J4V088_9MYCE|nr:hypothetical protein CYY_003392 [Polysphondylium violaceum]